MNILAVDDESLLLWQLTKELEKIFDRGDIHSCEEGDEALAYVEESASSGNPVQLAFLDIKLRGTTGIDVAREIKRISPDTRVIFCTAYSEYAMDAFGVYAIGYLLKPVNAEMIKKVLANANFSLQGDTKQKRIKVQTFGNFEVFVDGKQLFFEREKAKELFAYLVDRRGASVTNTEIALILWEDDTKVRNVGTIMSSLRKTLKDAGLQEVLVKARNHTAIDPSLIQCDLYDFYQGDPVAMNSYQGEYMINYSWAELTNGNLMTQQNN
ncbi:MAG: response regulator [Agathobacter sp.]|nr:response regulator [Agathobacter sp.]MDY3889232.1 response regulator [Agathobacter sp.]